MCGWTSKGTFPSPARSAGRCACIDLSYISERCARLWRSAAVTDHGQQTRTRTRARSFTAGKSDAFHRFAVATHSASQKLTLLLTVDRSVRPRAHNSTQLGTLETDVPLPEAQMFGNAAPTRGSKHPHHVTVAKLCGFLLPKVSVKKQKPSESTPKIWNLEGFCERRKN